VGLKFFVLFLDKHEDNVDNPDILARLRKQFISSAPASHKQQAFRSPEHFHLARSEPSPEGNPLVTRRLVERAAATRYGVPRTLLARRFPALQVEFHRMAARAVPPIPA
jgi:hypothetical protein